MGEISPEERRQVMTLPNGEIILSFRFSPQDEHSEVIEHMLNKMGA
jgi:hypothetical protein